MNELREITFEDGTTVRCQSVPPLAITAILANRPDCRVPPLAIEEIPSKGGTTRVPARPGSAEYEAWAKERDAAMHARQEVEEYGPYLIGVVDWKLPGETEFSSAVPKGWQFPPRIAMLGAKPHPGEDGRLWDWIIYGLLVSNTRVRLVQGAIFGDILSLREEEVQAAADLFPGDVGERSDTSAASLEDHDESPVRGDEDSDAVGTDPPTVVQ